MEIHRKESQGKMKHKIKIVFLGDKGVGKSSIIGKFIHNKFEENSEATIGVDFLTKMCKFNGERYKLELWDTAGQEKYRSLIKGYLRGANACVFVYDQSNPKTYLAMIDWVKTFYEVSNNQKTLAILFGNKTDIATDKTQLLKTKQQALKALPQLAEMDELQGSAKTGLNVNQIFEQILQNFQKDAFSNRNISSTRTIGENLVKTFKIQPKDGNSLYCCSV